MELLEGNVLSDCHAGMHLDAGGQNGGNLYVQLFPWEAVGGDAIAEHAAKLLFFFKNRYAVAHQAQIICAGKTARAAADDRHTLAGRCLAGRIRNVSRVVDRVALEAPDIDGRIYHIAAAARLARMLADIRAGCRHGVILSDQSHRVCVLPLAHQRNIARHIHTRGTQRHARHRILQRCKASVMLHMVHIVVPEAFEAAQNELRRVPADGAVGRSDDRARRFFDGIDRQHRAGAI